MLSGSGAASNHGGSETLELENVFKMFDSWWNTPLQNLVTLILYWL